MQYMLLWAVCGYTYIHPLCTCMYASTRTLKEDTQIYVHV